MLDEAGHEQLLPAQDSKRRFYVPCVSPHSFLRGNIVVMNIAKLMIPKVSTVFLHENNTVRQGLERFMIHGYTAIPVLNDKEQYIGSVTEGDFLRHLLAVHTTDLKMQEQYKIGDIVRRDFCPALQIDADRSQAVETALNQNFVPIVDSRGVLCGILTRKNLITYLAQQ